MQFEPVPKLLTRRECLAMASQGDPVSKYTRGGERLEAK
jgi:hypothetical protein